MSAFDVSVRRQGDTLVIVPSGELDIATVDRVRGVLADRSDGEGVEIDLRELRFLDTSGLRAVIEEDRRAAGDGRRLGIVPGSTAVQRVFELAGVADRLPFVDQEP